MNMNI